MAMRAWWVPVRQGMAKQAWLDPARRCGFGKASQGTAGGARHYVTVTGGALLGASWQAWYGMVGHVTTVHGNTRQAWEIE